jgi:hypothetical protein
VLNDALLYPSFANNAAPIDHLAYIVHGLGAVFRRINRNIDRRELDAVFEA